LHTILSLRLQTTIGLPYYKNPSSSGLDSFAVNLETYLVQLDDPGLRVAVVVEH